jgi:autotransporter-associated beta strand protein
VASRLSRIDEALTFNGGTLNLLGSSSAATVEIIQTKGTVSQASHGLIMNSGADVVNATAGTGQSTTLTFNDVYSRNAGASVLFEGTNLGSAPGANVATVLFGTPPTLTGSTGVAGTPTYGVIAGTYVDSVSTGGANSYSIATYDTTNGVRPLASSETIGTLTAGDNVLATSALTNSAVTINSLTLGTGGSIDNTAGILVDASGAILTTGASTSIGSAGGSTLQSGTTGTGTAELSIYNAPSSNLTIGASITTSGGLTKGGAGTTTLTGINSGLSGATTINGGILSISAANNLGSGSIAINNGAELQSTGATVSLSSPITVGGSTAGTLTSGDIDVSGASTNTLTASGVISGAGSLIKSGVGILALSNSNTYVGATIVKAGTLLVSGSLSGSIAVTVGDSANLSTSATLSGGGLVGNITVGAASGNTGATLAPSAGSSSTSAGTKLSTGSLTFFDGSANLSMEIGRTSAFSSGGGNGTAGGDVSDHVLTTGAITLNNANLNLSLLSTSYTLAAGDVLFLIINGSGSAVNGTFASLNGAATNLAQNAIFSFNSQNYEITYNANFTTNSFTGGNDIALEAVAVPEPGTWATVLGGLGVLVAFQRSRRRMVR